MKIFIDTVALKAIITPRDQWHVKALNISKATNLQTHILVTTDYIISEVFTLLLKTKTTGNRQILEIDRYIFKSGAIHLEWISKDRFYSSKELFKKVSKDKFWSFTDCTSFIVMKELKIKTVFTFDDHFQEMGFKLLE